MKCKGYFISRPYAPQPSSSKVAVDSVNGLACKIAASPSRPPGVQPAPQQRLFGLAPAQAGPSVMDTPYWQLPTQAAGSHRTGGFNNDSAQALLNPPALGR